MVSVVSLAEAAATMRAADDTTRLRVFFEIIRQFTEENILPSNALDLIREDPPSTGDTRFDALLAAAAEYIAAQYDRRAPAWAEAPGRFLHFGWWVADLPSARAHALVNTPASFQRRGIYLDRHDLQSA